MKMSKGKSAVLILSLLLATVFASSGFCAGTKIGITVPQTGAYAKQGEEQLNGYKLAIDEVNSQGGIPGGMITYSVANTQTDAEAGVAAARKLISEGAVLITGGSSSAVAAAVSAECQRSGVLFITGLTNANNITGQDAHRHTFRWYTNAHQSTSALAKVMLQRFGKNARYAYIYSDYSWGNDVTQTMRRTLEPLGGNTVYVAATPLGAKAGLASNAMKLRLGYLTKLEEAAKANPDVLVCVQFGSDLVAILQQATKMGLKNKMTIVCPIMDLLVAEEAGSDAIQGVVTTLPWYHGLANQYEGSRKFVQAYETAYGRKPSNVAAMAYTNIMVWADAVKRAGTTNPQQVIPVIEDYRYTVLMNQEYFRKWDHQGIRPILVVEGKNTPVGSQDFFSIIDQADGATFARNKAENPVQLELFPGEQADQASQGYSTGTGASAVSE